MLGRFFGFTGSSSLNAAEEIVKRLEEDRTEREVALHEAIAARKFAYDLAVARERFTWLVTGGVLTMALSAISAVVHKNFIYTLPIPPVVSTILYEAHFCYGQKLDIIRKMSNNILMDEDRIPISIYRVSTDKIDARIAEEKALL